MKRRKQGGGTVGAETTMADPDVPVPPDPYELPTPPSYVEPEDAGTQLGEGERMLSPIMAAPEPVPGCQAFVPTRDGMLREARCPRDAECVILLGFRPSVMVQVCREHGYALVESASKMNVYATSGT